MDTQNKPTEQDDTPPDAPQGMERRMVLRLLSQWREWQGDEDFPSFAAVDPDAVSDMWDYCFVLDFIDHEEDPVIRMVGPELAAYMPLDVSNCRLSEAPASSLIEHAASYYQEVLARSVPISRGGEFRKYDGKTVLYRSIILPMSDDGKTISGLLGAANCREVAGS